MSFSKAQDLLRLAQMAAARRAGVSLEDIRNEFGVSHRTAQRMIDALDTTFCNVTFTDTEDRKRYWHLNTPLSEALQPRQETALEALDMAICTAQEESRLLHAHALTELRDRILARLSPRDVTRSEADAEAVLASLGRVMRPGPKPSILPEVIDAIIEALRGPFQLRITYASPEVTYRIIEPHGLLLGHRNYLVARQPSRGTDVLSFRIDRIHNIEVLDKSFIFAENFSLKDYAAQAFGVYQNPKQYGEVIWRFSPEAVEHAETFSFHPTQVFEPQKDGSLIVRFNASGWLEMAWYLYQWGDQVDVLAPPELRAMVKEYQRSDFDSLP